VFEGGHHEGDEFPLLEVEFGRSLEDVGAESVEAGLGVGRSTVL